MEASRTPSTMAPLSLIFFRVPDSCATALVAATAMQSTRVQKRVMFVSGLQHLLLLVNVLQHLIPRNAMPQHQPPKTREALGALVRERFADLSPEFQRAARFLADHPDEIAVSSMRSLAARAGIQPPTLVRFAQSLGFPGWPAMREIFVASFRTRSVPYASRAKALVKRGGAADLVGEVSAAQKLDIDSTRMQSSASLPRVAGLLRRARTVHVAGFRASYAIAFGFAYLYRLFRPSVSLVGTEGGTLEMQLRAIAPGDAAVVVSLPPYSRESPLLAAKPSRWKSNG